MNDIKMSAIKKAAGLLRAAGAHFKIIYEDEVLYDNIPQKVKKTYKKTGVSYSVHFKPLIAPLHDPDTSHVRIQVPEELDVRMYRGALAGYLTKEFGNGSCITSINPATHSVEVLRAR